MSRRHPAPAGVPWPAIAFLAAIVLAICGAILGLALHREPIRVPAPVVEVPLPPAPIVVDVAPADDPAIATEPDVAPQDEPTQSDIEPLPLPPASSFSPSNEDEKSYRAPRRTAADRLNLEQLACIHRHRLRDGCRNTGPT